MHEGTIDAVGHIIAALLSKGEFGADDPAFDLVRDDEVKLAVDTVLSHMGARTSLSTDRCYLVPTDVSSPLLRGVPRMADVFRDQGRDVPGRANLMATLTLVVLRKLLDSDSEDGLSQAGRGGAVPVAAMVEECEDALRRLRRDEGLSEYMEAALKEWDRSSRPSTGQANVFSHEGYVRYVLRALRDKGLITLDNGDVDRMAYFAPTARLVAQAREVLNSERYQQVVCVLTGEEG